VSNVGAFVWKRAVIVIIVACFGMGGDRSGPFILHPTRDITENVWLDLSRARQAHDAIPEFGMVQKFVSQSILLRQCEIYDPIPDRRSLYQLRETRQRADRIMRLMPIWLSSIEAFDQRLRRLSGSLYVAIRLGECRSQDTQSLRESRRFVAEMRQELGFIRHIMENPDRYVPTRIETYEPHFTANMNLLVDLLE
jgi:hypothetical protein